MARSVTLTLILPALLLVACGDKDDGSSGGDDGGSSDGGSSDGGGDGGSSGGGSSDGGGDDGGSANTAPSAPGVALDPEAPLADEDLLCAITEDSVDAEGDAVSYAWAWLEDGVDMGVTGDTLAAADRTPWREYTCVVTPADDELVGEAGEASTTALDECVSVSLDTSSSYAFILPTQEDAGTFSMDTGYWTYEAWVRPVDTGASQYLFYKGPMFENGYSYDVDYYVALSSDQTFHFATGSSSGGDDCQYLRTVSPSWGEWQHLAVTIDVDGGHKSVWLGGELAAACTVQTPDSAPTDGPLWIGTKAWTNSAGTSFFTDLPWAGGIDEVRVSSTIRYSEDFEPERWFESDAHTEVLYHFSEGTGDGLEDASDHGRTGQSFDLVWDDESSTCDTL